MTRQRCFCLCACLTLSLTAMACGSSNSGAALPTGWDQARIGNTGVSWWVNAVKRAYFFSVKIGLSQPDDATGRSKVISFAQLVVGGLRSGSPAPQTLVPAADESSGWSLDPANDKTANGVATAFNSIDAKTLVGDLANAFYDSSKSYQAKGLAWEVYTNGTYSLDLKVWQMASAGDASKLYPDLLQDSLYSNVNWTTCSGSDPNNPCPAH